MRRGQVTRKTLLRNTILLVSLLVLGSGCSTAKPYLAQEGVDLVWLEKGQDLKAPVRGLFLSDSFYNYQFDRCK